MLAAPRALAACALAMLALSPAASLALDVNASVAIESEYTTNSSRAQRDEVGEWIQRPGLNVGATHAEPNLTLDADYSIERRIYQKDLFDDENATTGRGNLVWNAIPNRLDFTVSQTRTEAPIESIRSNTPANRQVTSNSQAGPTLRLRSRGEDEFQLQYMYGIRSSETTNNDATTRSATARYILVLSPTNRLNFEAINDKTSYDAPFAPDLNAKRGRITWSRTATTVDFSLTGGYNRTERTMDLDDVAGAIYNLSVDWQVRAGTMISLGASRDIQDQSENLLFGTVGFGEDLNGTNSDLNAVFTSNRQEISIAQRMGRNNVTLAIFNDEQDYEDVLRDSENIGARLTISREISPRSRIALALQQRTQDFIDQDDEVDEINASLRYTKEVGRRLSFSIGVKYEERQGVSDFGFGNEYEEWAGSIRVDYTLIEGRSN